MPKTLTVTTLAERIGVTRATIYNMLDDGRFNVPPIPGTKPRRWNIEDVDAWRGLPANTAAGEA